MTNNTTAGSGLNRKNSHLSERMTLRLLGGGLSETADSSRKEFQSAYVTDTRLMGVLGMRICWHLPDNTHYKYQYQFFYFDAEEYGFDRYESGLSPICCRDYHQDPSVVREYASSMFGGLGARKREIDEKQAIYILQRYAAFNRAHGIPMPSPSEEYAGLLDKECSLSGEEKRRLWEIVCVKVRSPYEAANYFLMRSFGKDFANFLPPVIRRKPVNQISRHTIRYQSFPASRPRSKHWHTEIHCLKHHHSIYLVF